MNQELISDFINYLKSSNKSDSTLIAYAKDLNQLAEISIKSLTDVSSTELTAALETMRDKLNLSPKTISRKLNSYRTFYKYLTQKGKVIHNPASSVAHPKLNPRKPRVLSSIEYFALREVSRENPRLHTMIELMLQTGIRIGEISRLKLTDVRIKRNKGSLFIEKYSTTKERAINLNGKIIHILQEYIRTNPSEDTNCPLFCTRDGKHIIIRNIRSSVDRAMAKAGIEKASVNDLRNTFIVVQLKAGVPIDVITEAVGHSKTTTQKYLSLLEKPYKLNGESKLAEL